MEKPFAYDSTITLRSPAHATMVATALNVDPELHPAHVTRTVVAEGSNVHVHFTATDARMLRGAVGTFSDLLALATKTAETFG